MGAHMAYVHVLLPATIRDLSLCKSLFFKQGWRLPVGVCRIDLSEGGRSAICVCGSP